MKAKKMTLRERAERFAKTVWRPDDVSMADMLDESAVSFISGYRACQRDNRARIAELQHDMKELRSQVACLEEILRAAKRKTERKQL